MNQLKNPPVPKSLHDPVKLHPENSKYFLFRGKPLVLLTATEHYGSILNRSFDFEKYLDDAAVHKMTLTRTFLLFRELQSGVNPYSPAKPDSTDFVTPYPRTGPGRAWDGEPKYDLDQWNPEYFERLHRFMAKASRLGIVVELTLFSNNYTDEVWQLQPYRHENNLQNTEKIKWPDFQSLKNPELVRRQMAFVRKIVQETNQYDNFYYETCNEPGVSDILTDNASMKDVDDWQAEIARVAREEMKKLGRTHLIAGQQGGIYEPAFRLSLDDSFAGTVYDIVNVHPLPNTDYKGRTYHMGNFFSKELELKGLSDFARAVFPEKKPVVMDEDNITTNQRNPTGWTVHRKRAWLTMFSGSHYDMIDFSIVVAREDGTPDSRAHLRTWFKYLSEFMASFDFVHSVPNHEWLKASGANVFMAGLVANGRDFVAYLADSREATDTTLGQPIKGDIKMSLPAGRYTVSLYSPVAGGYAPAIYVDGGPSVSLDLPPFVHDQVIRVVRNDAK